MSGEPIFVDEFTVTDMRDKLSFEYATIWSLQLDVVFLLIWVSGNIPTDGTDRVVFLGS